MNKSTRQYFTNRNISVIKACDSAIKTADKKETAYQEVADQFELSIKTVEKCLYGNDRVGYIKAREQLKADIEAGKISDVSQWLCNLVGATQPNNVPKKQTA